MNGGLVLKEGENLIFGFVAFSIILIEAQSKALSAIQSAYISSGNSFRFLSPVIDRCVIRCPPGFSIVGWCRILQHQRTAEKLLFFMNAAI